MKSAVSRRDFLKAGLVLPAARLRTTDPPLPPEAGRARPETAKLAYRTLGRTGIQVTSLAFGCMTTPEPSVIRRAADLGINHFDTARGYQNGNNERMVGAALKDLRQKVRERFLEIPRPARDVRCSDCSSCSFRCAYGVAVRDRVTHAQETLA